MSNSLRDFIHKYPRFQIISIMHLMSLGQMSELIDQTFLLSIPAHFHHLIYRRVIPEGQSSGPKQESNQETESLYWSNPELAKKLPDGYERPNLEIPSLYYSVPAECAQYLSQVFVYLEGLFARTRGAILFHINYIDIGELFER